MNSNYDIQQLIGDAATKAIQSLYNKDLGGTQLQFQKSRKEFEGDTTIVVFPLAKISGKGPEQTGNDIGQFLLDHVEEVEAFNVVKGFLNISLSEKFWLGFFKEAVSVQQFGFVKADSMPRVMVEFSSPNTNKPLHLGHLRNIFLGNSVAEILKAVGHKVTKVQIINDRGIHICKSMLAWEKFGNGETPQSSNLKGDKLVGKYYVEFDKEQKKQVKALIESGVKEEDAAKQTAIMQEAQAMLLKWEARDPDVMALWNKMNGWVYEGFDQTYKTIGVEFDKLYYESETYINGKAEVEIGLNAGIFFRKEDGSVWIDLTNDGLDEKVVLRKDGTAMYITQDIGTAILRFRDFPDLAYQIYTVGNEQEYHFRVLIKILKKLGFDQADKCYHLSYGMVELPEGKMKSREGTVVDADDLMAAMADVAKEVAQEQGKLEGLPEAEKDQLYNVIGMAAIKYFLLRVDPVKNMMFDPKESIDFNGNTGPSVQYTYVRTLALLRKAAEGGMELDPVKLDFSNVSGLKKTESDLISKIYDWPEVLRNAAASYNPADVAHYCYDLARTYNAFYHENPIIRESDEALRFLRLSLTKKTGEVIKDGMGLLGIAMPDRM